MVLALGLVLAGGLPASAAVAGPAGEPAAGAAANPLIGNWPGSASKNGVLTGVVAPGMPRVSTNIAIDLNDATNGNMFTNWTYHSSERRYVVSRDVSVIGQVANATATLDFWISPGATVSWHATYSASAGIDAIAVSGGGTLSIRPSGSITSTISYGTGVSVTGPGTAVVINGGTVSGPSHGILAAGGATVTVNTGLVTGATAIGGISGNVTVIGGVVRGIHQAIWVDGNINMTGGTLEVSGYTLCAAIYKNNGGNVVVSGGRVAATVDSCRGIWLQSAGSVTVQGGAVVAATVMPAIETSGGNITVSGGLVFAYGTAVEGTRNVVYRSAGGTLAVSGTGVVVAWNKAAGRTKYVRGSTLDLVIRSAGLPTSWDVSGRAFCVHYGTRFFSIAGLSEYFPVTSISGVPASVMVGPVALFGVVAPANATQKTITWRVVDAGTTGAVLSGGLLTTSKAGTVKLRATVVLGSGPTTDFVKDFSIKVTAPKPPDPTKPPKPPKPPNPPKPSVGLMVQMVLSKSLVGSAYGDVVAVDPAGMLWRFPSSKSGVLGKGVKLGGGWKTQTVYAPGDWDGDGKADLVGVNTAGQMWLYPGTGKGGFAKARQIGHGWYDYRVIPAGDLTGDGVPDMLAINTKTGVLLLYRGDGKGGFLPGFTQVGHRWLGKQLLAAGDLNRDGRLDILGVRPDGTLWFYAGRGTGFFKPAVQVGHGWKGLTLVAGADLNGDKIADIASRTPAGVLNFYKGKGSGTFYPPVPIGSGF